jgi:hypothetical protein
MSDKHASRGAAVRAVNAEAGFNPQSAITIAVDTAYVISNGGGLINTGVYMFDNRLTNGSTGESSLELNSKVNLGDLIGFEVVPINPNSQDKVEITGFQVSSGTVFGSTGFPVPESADRSYWVGQAVNATQSTTYQIQIRVTTGVIRPVRYYVTWDPFIGTN